jgi:predicted site-specific integrase-resolvase
MARPIFSTWDVARRAGVTPERVRQWVREGKLDAVLRQHGRYRYRLFLEDDVEAFLRARALRRAVA